MKRFFTHIQSSESWEDYYFDFWHNKMPENDDEWLDLFYRYISDVMEEQEENGPGICGTSLHVRHCQELWMPEEFKSNKSIIDLSKMTAEKE